jgi:hypothetical protein
MGTSGTPRGSGKATYGLQFLPSELLPLLAQHRTTVAATASAIVGVGFGYPFDAIKTRLQTSRFPSMNAW